MPPKKKAKSSSGTAASAAGTTAASRTKSTRGAARGKTEALSAPATTNGKRKRNNTTTAITIDESESEAEAVPAAKGRAAVGGKKSTAKSKAAAAATKFSAKRCESWYKEYADPGSNEIDAMGFGKWLEDLGQSPEGMFMYYILWQCNAETTMTLTELEFVKFMTDMQVDSNEKLLDKLRDLNAIESLSPKIDNSGFTAFYKWNFQHFKGSAISKNITLDVAGVLFQTLLDDAKYSLTWTPSGDTEQTIDTDPPRLNHVNAFVEFINSDSKPVAVISKDQYEQFFYFNKQVKWNLEGYSEETSTWPTLMDNYVTWKKEHYPTDAAQNGS